MGEWGCRYTVGHIKGIEHGCRLWRGGTPGQNLDLNNFLDYEHILDFSVEVDIRPVREGVSTDSLKFFLARHAQPLYALRAGGLRPSSSPLDTPSRMGLVDMQGF